MTKSFYLFAFFCLLAVTNAKDFLAPAYENEEMNWENEECSWEEENEYNADFDFDGSAGKAADVVLANIQGDSPEDIGNAVKDGIVKIGNTIADDSANPSGVPLTGNPANDQVIESATNAINSIGQDVKNGAESVGNKVGSVVTDSLNAVGQTPDDISGAVGSSVTEGVAGLKDNANDIGNAAAGSVSDAIQQVVGSLPNAQTSQVISQLNQNSDQLATTISSLITSAANNADAIGSSAGNSIADAVNKGGDAASTVGDSVANWDQTVKDNASGIANAIGDALSNADPTLTQEDLDSAKTQITESIESTTQADVDQSRNDVVESVNNAINTVQNQGGDAKKDVVGVIGALADQVIAAGQNGNQ